MSYKMYIDSKFYPMITERPKREFTVPYPITRVQTALNDILRLNKYVIYKNDPVLNYWRLGLTRLLNTGILNITILKIDENTTNCKFEMENNPGSNTPTSILDSMMNDYLSLFSDLVSGKKVITIKKLDNGALRKARLKALIILFLVIGFIVGTFWFIHYMDHK